MHACAAVGFTSTAGMQQCNSSVAAGNTLAEKLQKRLSGSPRWSKPGPRRATVQATGKRLRIPISVQRVTLRLQGQEAWVSVNNEAGVGRIPERTSCGRGGSRPLPVHSGSYSRARAARRRRRRSSVSGRRLQACKRSKPSQSRGSHRQAANGVLLSTCLLLLT